MITSDENSDLNLDFDQPLLFNVKRLLRLPQWLILRAEIQNSKLFYLIFLFIYFCCRYVVTFGFRCNNDIASNYFLFLLQMCNRQRFINTRNMNINT